MNVNPINWDFRNANNPPTNTQSSSSSPAIQASVSISATNNQQAAIARHLANSSLENDFNPIQHISIPGMQISIGPASAQNLNFNLATGNLSHTSNYTNSINSQPNILSVATPSSPSSSRVEQIATQAAIQAATNAALQFHQTVNYDFSGTSNRNHATLPYHHRNIHHRPHTHQVSSFSQEQGDSMLYENDLNSYAYQQAAGIHNTLNMVHLGPPALRNGNTWINYPYINRERFIGRHIARIPTRFGPNMHYLDRSLEDIVRLEENLLNANRGANQETIEANTLPYKYSKV